MVKREVGLPLFASLLMLALLSWQSWVVPIGAELLLPMLLFGSLALFSLSFGVSWQGGTMSALPVISAVCFITLGILPAAWVIFITSWLHGLVRHRFHRTLGILQPFGRSELLGRTAANSFINTLSALSGAWAFLAIQPNPCHNAFTLVWILALLYFALTYLTVNYSLIVTYYRLFAPAQVAPFLQKIPALLFYEGIPLIFVPFISDVYLSLGVTHFAMFSLIIISFSAITHSLNRTRQVLEQRLLELDGLQSVGRTLGASLELDKVLHAIYEQVRQLLPADTFYVALYDETSRQISFPFFIREGELITFPSRRPANGITEYILRTRQPLLIPEKVGQHLTRLKLDQIGPLAASYIGVPILARGEVLGVMSAQSLKRERTHTLSHQRLLEMVATQAALAIQNAGLYGQIRSSLVQRMQELNSIFRATQDGILLLGPDWELLAANRAFSNYAGLIGIEAKGQLATSWPTEGDALLTRLGYTPEGFLQDCQWLLQEGEGAQLKKQITIGREVPHVLERVLTAVYHTERQEVRGWLIVLHDVTEEVELNRLREEMTHMLVHDLRAPLSLILSNLELSHLRLINGQQQHVADAIVLAEKSGQRMMRLINDLLAIYRLETGKVPLNLQQTPVIVPVQDVVAQFATTVQQVNLSLEVDVPQNLPPLWVDYEHVTRLLYNLVDNAVKFTPDNGRVHIWARLDATQKPQSILIGVTDNGPGILPALHPTLFEKFNLIGMGGRRSGSGLGLAYCRLVAEAHGGEIWVESSGQPGKGSTFMVRLPIAEDNT